MNLEKIRKAKGLNQTQLGEKVGLDQSTISKFENGGRNISLHAIDDICQALDCTLVDLFGDERSDAEYILITAFRKLREGRKEGWIDMAKQTLREVDPKPISETD